MKIERENLNGQERPKEPKEKEALAPESPEKTGEKTPGELALAVVDEIKEKEADFLAQTEAIIKQNPNLSEESLGQLEEISKEARQIASQAREEILGLTSQEVLPSSEKLQELTPEELSLIEEKYKINKEEAVRLILNGLNFLGATKVTPDPEVLSAKEFLELSERDLLKEASENPSALDVGEMGDDAFGIYVKSKNFNQVLGEKGPHSQCQKLKYENIDEINVFYWGDNIEKGLSKLTIPNDEHPQLSPLFSYGVYNQRSELVAILCFKTNALDKEADFSSGEIVNFDRVFYRHYSAENKDTFDQYTKEADGAIGRANFLLGLPKKAVPAVELILNGRKQFQATAPIYLDSDGLFHHLILVSKARLDLDLEGPTITMDEKNRARIIRHEYLHALDHFLGEGRRPFSVLHTKELVEIVDKYLFGGKLKTVKVCEGGDSPPWFAGSDDDMPYKVSKNFTEHYFLPDCPMAGHAKDHISELFVSALNNYLDPDFKKGLELKVPLERDNITKMYEEIIGLVKKRIKEKYEEK